MTSQHRDRVPTEPPHGRVRRWALCSVVAGAMAAQSLVGVPAGATDPGPPPPPSDPVVSDVTLVHANIKTAMATGAFRADVQAVVGQKPDFVTYNEVPRRLDANLAPEGYALWRTPGQYEGATPVAWRTDTWSPINQGTRQISNYRKIPPRRHTMLGLRYANWVTLQSTDGRLVSVVSVHVPPMVKGMPDLRRRTVAQIALLVGELKATGPVLVAGDFNVHYRSRAYPRDLLEAAGMVPTYDALGSYFPTGDHQGATIDYIFTTALDQMTVVEHHATELNSDHDAITGGLSWTADAPGQTIEVVNNPAGAAAERRAVLRTVLQAVRHAQPGTRLDLVTGRVVLWRLVKQVREAHARGVALRILFRNAAQTPQERELTAILGVSAGDEPGTRVCADACLEAWREAATSRTFVLLRSSEGEPQERIDVDRNLQQSVITLPSRAVTRVGPRGLAEGAALIASLG